MKRQDRGNMNLVSAFVLFALDSIVAAMFVSKMLGADISWGVVFSPLWVPGVFLAAVYVICVCGAILFDFLDPLE